MKKKFKTKWIRQELTSSLDEFEQIYNNRPIKENGGGMKSPHMFPAWFIVRETLLHLAMLYRTKIETIKP